MLLHFLYVLTWNIWSFMFSSRYIIILHLSLWSSSNLFLYMVRGRGQCSFFSPYGYPVISASFVVKTFFLTIRLLWCLCTDCISVSLAMLLTYLFIHMPPYLDYCSFRVYIEGRWYMCSNCGVFLGCFRYYRSFAFLCIFKHQLGSFYKNIW